MGLQVIALGCLIGAIVLGFVKKTNVGLVCFGLALILGKIGGMGASDIYKGFFHLSCLQPCSERCCFSASYSRMELWKKYRIV
ncbi:MAG: hypothetical protein ACLR3S_05395 [Clostridium fessum]